MHILRYMGQKYYVKFQRAPLKFHTKVWTHTPQDMHFTVFNFCVWVTISLNCDVISLSETVGWRNYGDFIAWIDCAFGIIGFLEGIHRWPISSHHKGPVRWSLYVSSGVCLKRLLNKQPSFQWLCDAHTTSLLCHSCWWQTVKDEVSFLYHIISKRIRLNLL